MAVKKVCVISGRSVYSRRTGVWPEGGNGSDINLTNDEEEGLVPLNVWGEVSA